jgi:hypothetical protein
MTRIDPAAAVLADRIALTAPGTLGPNALIGTLLPRVLHVAVLAVGHDGAPASAGCAEQFADHAVHGGFATDRGFTWNRPTIHLHGACTSTELLASAGQEGALAALFTQPEASEGIELHLSFPDGTAVTEDSGLSDLRARLATGHPALPVNSQCTGMIIDHRQKGTL